MNNMVLKQLEKKYRLRHLNIGDDSHLKAKGMEFYINSYDIEGYGHLCTISMKGMFGLMKMETAVISAENKDMPLFNLDRVDAFGKHTQMVEFYDNQIEPVDERFSDAFMAIKEHDKDIEDRKTSEHWYDDILYPFSYDKTLRGKATALERACENYLNEYLKQAETSKDCNRTDKMKKTADFARGLLSNGGPAVDTFKKLFGEAATERIVLRHMYGIEE